jgi:hypothetical protein
MLSYFKKGPRLRREEDANKITWQVVILSLIFSKLLPMCRCTFNGISAPDNEAIVWGTAVREFIILS